MSCAGRCSPAITADDMARYDDLDYPVCAARGGPHSLSEDRCRESDLLTGGYFPRVDHENEARPEVGISQDRGVRREPRALFGYRRVLILIGAFTPSNCDLLQVAEL